MLSKGRKSILTIILVLTCLCLLSSLLLAKSPAQRESNGILVLMTDWGTRDFYVAAVKGVALSVFPEITLVDLTHDVDPFELWEGAGTLLLASREFPSGTTFIAIVDPGVGTERRPIAMKTGDGKFFIGPDNGILTLVGAEFGIEEVRHITNRSYMRPGEISYTFHGRDIFTPAAANIAAGRPFQDVGPVIDDYELWDVEPPVYEQERMVSQIVGIDHYGNIRTNVTSEFFAKLGAERFEDVLVRIGDIEEKAKFVYTYGDVPVGDFLIYVASTDFVHVAINWGNAAEHFSASLMDEAIFSFIDSN